MKNQFANKPEGLRQIRDHRWKTLGEENSDLLGSVLCDLFDLFFIITLKTMSEHHLTKTKQNQIRLVEYSCAEVSGSSEVLRFVWELILLVG